VSNQTRHALAYIRVSTEDENPENQLQAILDFAAANGFEIVKVFSDIGISGGEEAFKRPQFAAMYQYAKNNGVRTIIVYDLSRLGRDIFDVLQTYKTLLEDGFNILFVKNPELNVLDSNSPVSQAVRKTILALLAAAAEIERAMIRERTKTALARLKKQGKKLGRPEIPLPIDDIRRMLRRGFTIKEIYEILLKEGKICRETKDGKPDCLSYDTLRKKIRKLKEQGIL